MKKIIHLNENDIYRIVKRVISEDVPSLKLYTMKGRQENVVLTIQNGRLYGAGYNDSTGRMDAVVNLNGLIDDFKVKVSKTGEKYNNGLPKYSGIILNQNFADNNQSLKYGGVGETKDEEGFWGMPGGYLNQLDSYFKPGQTRTQFSFFGITPEGQPNAGLPRTYTADIVVLPLIEMDALKKTETTEKDVISPSTYQRLGKFGKKKNYGVTIRLYPAPNPAEIYQGFVDIKIPKKIKFAIKVTDPFEFDKTVFYPETKQTLDNFVSEINQHLNNESYGQQFREFLSQNPINVFAYASIDADSKEISQGRLPSCQDPTQTKEEYNLCLSNARANVVKDYLESNIEGINVVAEGKGETDKFAPGKKWPDVKDPKQTKENRALEIIVPEFSTEID